MSQQPNARILGLQVLETACAHQERYPALRRDDEGWPDVTTGSHIVVVADAVAALPPVVIVLPVTTGGRIAPIRQHRYTVDDWVWEVPAGGSHGVEGDDLADLARRDLKEEIGGEAKDVTHTGVYHPAAGRLNVNVPL